eukprot:2527498-Pleurochrysis_carterae.AAC.1
MQRPAILLCEILISSANRNYESINGIRAVNTAASHLPCSIWANCHCALMLYGMCSVDIYADDAGFRSRVSAFVCSPVFEFYAWSLHTSA